MLLTSGSRHSHPRGLGVHFQVLVNTSLKPSTSTRQWTLKLIMHPQLHVSQSSTVQYIQHKLQAASRSNSVHLSTQKPIKCGGRCNGDYLSHEGQTDIFMCFRCSASPHSITTTTDILPTQQAPANRKTRLSNYSQGLACCSCTSSNETNSPQPGLNRV